MIKYINNIILKIKYKIIRYNERIPFLNLFILNNIYYFRFLLPHDKDFLGLKKFKFDKNFHIVDIGGNVGSSILSFKKLKLNNKIFCFEPNYILVKNNLNFIKKKFSNISIFNLGLGKKNSILTLHIPLFKDSPIHYFASFDENYVKNSMKITFSKNLINLKIKKKRVKVRKLDSFGNIIKPCLIKIDTEGNDLNVVKGGLKLIKKFKPIILIEFNRNIMNDLIKILKDYKLYYYDFEKEIFIKINNIVKYDNIISRTNKNNLLTYRNLYFIPRKKNENISYRTSL